MEHTIFSNKEAKVREVLAYPNLHSYQVVEPGLSSRAAKLPGLCSQGLFSTATSVNLHYGRPQELQWRDFSLNPNGSELALGSPIPYTFLTRVETPLSLLDFSQERARLNLTSGVAYFV